MNKRISRAEFHDAIERRLSSLKSDPFLAQRIIASEKEEKPVVKKFAASVVIAVILVCVLVTGALAAALNSWGIIDFAGRHANTYIPPRYEESITHMNAVYETEDFSCTFRESYFDGMILRITAQIVSKTGALLMAPHSSVDDPVSEIFREVSGPQNGEAGSETIGAYALRKHGGRLAAVNLSADLPWEEYAADFIGNSDGSYTFYVECQCPDERASIDAPLTISYRPITVTEDAEGQIKAAFDTSEPDTLSVVMTFDSTENKVFVCDTPLDFPSTGARVTRIEMTVTPLEIRYLLDFEITDLAKFTQQEDGLWFEFIDPESTAATYYGQRVSDGLTSFASIRQVDGDYDSPETVGTVFRQNDSIGLDSFGGTYTIRAFNAWEKDRYETVTFTVKEAE